MRKGAFYRTDLRKKELTEKERKENEEIDHWESVWERWMLCKKLQKEGKRVSRMPDPLEERIKEAALETETKDFRDHEIPS
jgi:hypothetical protein